MTKFHIMPWWYYLLTGIAVSYFLFRENYSAAIGIVYGALSCYLGMNLAFMRPGKGLTKTRLKYYRTVFKVAWVLCTAILVFWIAYTSQVPDG